MIEASRLNQLLDWLEAGRDEAKYDHLLTARELIMAHYNLGHRLRVARHMIRGNALEFAIIDAQTMMPLGQFIDEGLRTAAFDVPPCAYMRDAHEGQADECLVPCAKGDPGAFAVYRRPE